MVVPSKQVEMYDTLTQTEREAFQKKIDGGDSFGEAYYSAVYDDCFNRYKRRVGTIYGLFATKFDVVAEAFVSYIHQVWNGGHSQWYFNGYFKEHRALMEEIFDWAKYNHGTNADLSIFRNIKSIFDSACSYAELIEGCRYESEEEQIYSNLDELDNRFYDIPHEEVYQALAFMLYYLRKAMNDA